MWGTSQSPSPFWQKPCLHAILQAFLTFPFAKCPVPRKDRGNEGQRARRASPSPATSSHRRGQKAVPATQLNPELAARPMDRLHPNPKLSGNEKHMVKHPLESRVSLRGGQRRVEDALGSYTLYPQCQNGDARPTRYTHSDKLQHLRKVCLRVFVPRLRMIMQLLWWWICAWTLQTLSCPILPRVNFHFRGRVLIDFGCTSTKTWKFIFWVSWNKTNHICIGALTAHQVQA